MLRELIVINCVEGIECEKTALRELIVINCVEGIDCDKLC